MYTFCQSGIMASRDASRLYDRSLGYGLEIGYAYGGLAAGGDV